MATNVAIVLAAGKGVRMKSDLPKVLVPVCGRPMIDYVLDVLLEAGLDRVLVVVGYRHDLVREALAGRPRVTFIEQTEQLGTGHAVMMCRPHLEQHDGAVLVVTGDSPLIQRESVGRLLEEFQRDRPACLLGTAHKENPTGLGRIVRDEAGRFQAIVEERDASEAQRRITEVNMSTYVFNCRDLLDALAQVKADNRQREYYLTDCPGILKRSGRLVRALDVLKPIEALSINTPEELAVVEQVMRELPMRQVFFSRE
jgi:bifunctional UDP-N-acetylglucosamine pyrophosphorylase/glucosamine-1-phosphate N-acetyltransferase/UDP-N-acetylglucosamine pyrophosphorylase